MEGRTTMRDSWVWGEKRRRERVNTAGNLSSSLWPRNEVKELGGYLCVGRVHWRPPRT